MHLECAFATLVLMVVLYKWFTKNNNKIVALVCVNKQGYYHPEEIFTKISNLLESEAFKGSLNQSWRQ